MKKIEWIDKKDFWKNPESKEIDRIFWERVKTVLW